MLPSRLALGVVTFALAIVCIAIGDTDVTGQYHDGRSKVTGVRTRRTPLVSAVDLSQLSQPVFRLRNLEVWLARTPTTVLSYERPLEAAPFREAREPDFCVWSNQTFKVIQHTAIVLHGNPTIGGPRPMLTWMIAEPPAWNQTLPTRSGKLDILAMPQGPWILE